MAQERLSGQVALRLFLMLVGVLFIWNSIPSHRWTQSVSSNIQSGLWTTCSCVDNGFKSCARTYTDLEKAWFRIEEAKDKNTSVANIKNSDAKGLRNDYKVHQYLFKQHNSHTNVNQGHDSRNNKNHTNNNNNNNKHNGNNNHHNNNNSSTIQKDSKQCTQYNGSGAIALISYIFGFFAVLVIISNVSSNVVPVLNGPVFGLIILSGIFGLIATCMFGDLFGHDNYPFGYDFGLFVTAWVLLLVVGLTGLADMRGNGRESPSAIRAALLVIALTCFAFSMGDNWYSHDDQDLLAPLGGRDWTIKDKTFFIEPYTKLGVDATRTSTILVAFDKLYGGKGIRICNHTHNGDDYSHLDAQDYQLHIKREADLEVEERNNNNNNNNNKNNNNKGNHHHPNDRNHTTSFCSTPPDVQVVKGTMEIGLWATCYCKNTLSTQCRMFGSDYIMFNNKQKKCDTFNVARAMILIVGILALIALIVSSALIGGLRRVQLHALSNVLCLLTSVLGLISSILIGVLYDVNNLGRDYAIYLAGWILVFFAFCIGGPVTSYYKEVESAGQVVPLQPMAPVVMTNQPVAVVPVPVQQ